MTEKNWKMFLAIPKRNKNCHLQRIIYIYEAITLAFLSFNVSIQIKFSMACIGFSTSTFKLAPCFTLLFPQGKHVGILLK